MRQKTKKLVVFGGAVALSALNALAARQGPWTKEKAWEWYNAQPWIRGCNYMPASAANRVDQWQALGAEERFAEVERELALAEKIGFNTLRLIVEHQGFGVWLADHDGFMSRFSPSTRCAPSSSWATTARVRKNFGNCRSRASRSMMSATTAAVA